MQKVLKEILTTLHTEYVNIGEANSKSVIQFLHFNSKQEVMKATLWAINWNWRIYLSGLYECNQMHHIGISRMPVERSVYIFAFRSFDVNLTANISMDLCTAGYEGRGRDKEVTVWPFYRVYNNTFGRHCVTSCALINAISNLFSLIDNLFRSYGKLAWYRIKTTH